MATLHEAHMACVHAVNTAPNEAIHRSAEQYLSAWRDGVAEALAWDGDDCGAFLMAADNHYLNQPEHAGRPMCGGVWLDWEPAPIVECDVCGKDHATANHRDTYEDFTRADAEF